MSDLLLFSFTECHLLGDVPQNNSLIYNELDPSLIKIGIQSKDRKGNITIVMKKVNSMTLIHYLI